MRSALHLLLVFALFLCPVASFAMSKAEIVEDFETFWKSYKDAYVFFDLKKKDHGVDWDELHAAYRPRAEKCSTKAELVRIITEMQCRLQDGHCGNMGLSDLMNENPVLLEPIGFVPVEGNEIAVAGVRPGTPPAEAGIERGDVLLAFAGKPIATLAREARLLFAASTEGQFWNNFSRMAMIWNPLLGEAPESCKIKVRKPDGEILEADLPWMTYAPKEEEAAAAEPAKKDRRSAKRRLSVEEIQAEGPLPISVKIFTEAQIAYMKIDSWMKTEHPGEQLNAIFEKIADTKGLVLDLRGNGGGVGPWGVLFCTYLVGSDTESGQKPNDAWMERKLSQVFFRTVLSQADDAVFEQLFTEPESMQYVLGRLGVEMELAEVKKHFVDGRFQPFEVRLLLNGDESGVPVYDKPVIALTDGGCYSTTDICLKILQDFGRITIVGSPNGAGSGSPIPFVLPHSKVQVMVPHARAYPPMGGMVEGRSCRVDVPCETTVEDLIQGTDPVFTAGLQTLVQKLSGKKGRTRLTGMDLSPSDIDGDTVADTRRERPIGTPQLVPDWMIEARIRAGACVDAEDLRGLRGR